MGERDEGAQDQEVTIRTNKTDPVEPLPFHTWWATRVLVSRFRRWRVRRRERLHFMPFTVDVASDGSGVYIQVGPEDVLPARSVFADDMVTLDYDGEGRLLGVEVTAFPR